MVVRTWRHVNQTSCALCGPREAHPRPAAQEGMDADGYGGSYGFEPGAHLRLGTGQAGGWAGDLTNHSERAGYHNGQDSQGIMN